MTRLSSRVRAAIYAVLRPVYRRVPLLQRMRGRYHVMRAGFAQRLQDALDKPENLLALQALTQRRHNVYALQTAKPAAQPIEWPLIDVSVVTYNSQRWVEKFLASLLAQHYPCERIHLYFVDHGSKDDTVSLLHEQAKAFESRFASFTVIEQNNLGFGTGHHRAISTGTSPYCLVSNIDLEFRGDSLTAVVATALSDTQGQVASWELRQIPYEHPKYYDPVTLETNWSSHACILMRRSAYEEVGGYDPRIFMYAEDVEMSYRFRSYGFALKYVPQAAVHHYTYESAGEIKPMQYSGSTLGNLYLRLRYGSRQDWHAGLLLYLRLLQKPAPFPGAHRLLLKNLVTLYRNKKHFQQGRGPASAHFPFRGFDYELTRDGAFHEATPIAPEDAPLVSVITRTYKGRGMFLGQALQSILNQTYPNIELIVVEDGGDTQREVVDTLTATAGEGRKLRFLPQAKLGRSAAGNAGLAAAGGSYMMFLDDDDLLFADHIETLVGALKKDKSLSAAYALAWEVFTDVSADKQRYTETRYTTPALFYQEWDHECMQNYNFIPIQAIVFKRKLYETCGGFDTELDQLEDWHLWLRYGYRRRFQYLAKTTSLFRSPAHPETRVERAGKLNEAYHEAKQRAQAWFVEADAKVGQGKTSNAGGRT